MEELIVDPESAAALAPAVVVAVDADSGDPFPFGEAAEWAPIVLSDGVAVGYPRLSDPGPAGCPVALTELAIGRHANAARRRRALIDRLAARLGEPADATPPRHLRVSVVVTTRRRPARVAQLLESLAALDPAPDEVIVVDNDPGTQDCEAVAEAAGARYVREDAAGQNRARARGLAMAEGDLVAYTDDDCLAPPGWLAHLDKLFANPTVGAVTGPAFAADLDTPARQVRERDMPFVFGLRRERWDWGGVRPITSGATGAGANMIFRRRLLEALGDPFPPELDGGTPTLSGGDLHVLYRVLAAGWRVVWDPGTWTRHVHPADMEEVLATAYRYGVGFSSFLAKALAEQRELATFAAWFWVPRQYVRARWRRVWQPRPLEVGVRAAYLRGALQGPGTWLTSRLLNRGGGRPTVPGSFAEVAGEIHGLSRSAVATSGIELVCTPDPVERNRRTRASTARVLLFTDSEPERPDELLALHAAAHSPGLPAALAAGLERSAPHGASLAAALDAWRIEDAAVLARRASVATVADVNAGNLSIERERLLALGGFDERLAGPAGARELALRASKSGVGLVTVPGVEVERAPARTTGALLRAARRDGFEHGLVWHAHREVAAFGFPGARPLLTEAIGLPGGIPFALALAAACEWAGLRGTWRRVVAAAESAAFQAGWRAAGAGSMRSPSAVLELGHDEFERPASRVAPDLEIHALGTRIAHVRPKHGRWGPALAEQIADALVEEGWRMAALAAGLPGDATPALPPERSALRHEIVRPPAGGPWGPALGELVRGSDADVVVALLPGVEGGPGWDADLRAAFSAPGLAVLTGAGRGDAELARPLILRRRRLAPQAFPAFGRAAQYLAVRRDAFLELGGFGSLPRGVGPQGAVLALVDRALAAGALVGYLEVAGLSPWGTMRPYATPGEWALFRDRGALLAASAGERGAAWFAGQTLAPALLELLPALRPGHDPSLRRWLGTTGAMLAGGLRATLYR